jgi:hypothetical protein
LVASVNVGRFSIERVYETVELLVPSGLDQVIAERKGNVPPLVVAGAVMREFAVNETLRKQRIAQVPNDPLVIADRTSKQFKELGIEQVLIVLAWTDPEKMRFSTYVLAEADENLSPEQQAKRIAGLTKVSKSFGARVEKVPGWIVLHAEASLPKVIDEFALSDASFTDALLSSSNYDIGVAFVATEKMRKQITSGIDSLVGTAKPNEIQATRVAQQIGKIVDSDWQSVGVNFGTEPVVRVAANFGEADDAKQYLAALDKLLNELPKFRVKTDKDKEALDTIMNFAGKLKTKTVDTKAILELGTQSIQRLADDSFRRLPPPKYQDPGRVSDGPVE